jgi:CRISPR/Cas system-associated exonuclease Cas4 (RecB family)
MSVASDIDFQSLKTTGIKVNYLYVCEKKLWLFDRGIQMESKSDKVLMIQFIFTALKTGLIIGKRLWGLKRN